MKERIAFPIGHAPSDDPQRPPRGVTLQLYEERATGILHLTCEKHGVWTREKTAGKRDWEPWQKLKDEAS